ncbi:MAG: type II toxin-antitoxin system VapC family toxin [Gammaproteobacteria bacterium]|nr:type II toxin-antitoxin system VapC family toxin [Gammaproteobacteria bacterium]
MTQPFIAEPKHAYHRLPPIVVDCSVLAALLFHESRREPAAMSLVGKSLFAPRLIDDEIISVALKKASAGAPDVAKRGLDNLSQFNLTRRDTNALARWQLARRTSLSAYDAAYLQLAIELNAPLATFDRALAAAASEVLGNQ